MARDGDVGPQLRAQFTYLLKRALRDLEELHREHLTPYGITGRELGVLLLIEGHEPESQQQVASRLEVDRTTMVSLLDTLQDKGLVARQPDPDDRRRNVIDITAAGRRTLRQALRASGAAERQLLTSLDDDEGALLRDLLTRVADTERDRRA